MASSSTIIPKAGAISAPDPPDISSVDFIQQVVENVKAQLSQLDEELALASRGDTGLVKALFDSMREMKSRSEQAEMILAQMKSSPDNLKPALTKLEAPSKTFAKVLKLISSTKELEKELREGEYDYFRVVAELLQDVQQQLDSFAPYGATSHLTVIRNKIDAIKKELSRQVHWSFREIGPLTSSEKYGHEAESDSNWDVDVSPLLQAYLVVDVLGDKFRMDLLERFAQLQLIPYEKLFQKGTKYAPVEFLEQRYAWFRFLLRTVDEKLAGIFPSKWQVGLHLFIEFARRTTLHLSDVLAEQEQIQPQDANSQVAAILKAIKSIMSFEAEIISTLSGEDENENPLMAKFSSIRNAFDPYLGPYIQLERRGLEELMEAVMKEEEIVTNVGTTVPAGAASAQAGTAAAHNSEGGAPQTTYKPGEPFESSRKMFEYIKGSLKRCTGFSTGMAFLSLSKEFRICLQNYSEALKHRCPPPAVAAKGDKPPVYIITKKAEILLCRIISTGEYCIDTIPALESMIKSKISDSYQAQVDFTSENDCFMDMLTQTMGILAAGELQRMEPEFQAMKKLNWSTMDSVGDVSIQTKNSLKIFSDCIPRIRLTMSSAYFQNFCIKFVTLFLDTFLDNIYSLKRISKAGGGQLLLDTNDIKEYMVKMPNIRLPEGKEPLVLGAAYHKSIEKKIGKIENILKLICTEDSMVHEMFEVLWPTATQKEIDNILVLKGMKMNLIPIEKLENVGDAIRDSAKVVGQNAVGKIKNASQGAIGGVSSGFMSVGGNLRNAFGDMMSGNLFADDSNHGTHGHQATAHNSTGGGTKLKPVVNAATALSGMQSGKKPSGATSIGASPVKK